MSVNIDCNKCDDTIETNDMVFCKSCYAKLVDKILNLENENRELQVELKDLTKEIDYLENQLSNMRDN